MNDLEVKKYRKKLNLSQKEFAKILGVGERAVQTWESGERNISRSAELLLDYIVKENEQSSHPNSKPKDLIKPYSGEIPKGSKPFVNFIVTAGKSIAESVGAVKPSGYMENIPINGFELTEWILPVKGFSMVPEILEDAVIGVKKMERLDTLRTDKKYVIVTNDERMTKYIEHDENNDDILWCVSPNYPKFKIYKEDILEIHRVTFVMNPA